MVLAIFSLQFSSACSPSNKASFRDFGLSVIENKEETPISYKGLKLPFKAPARHIKGTLYFLHLFAIPEIVLPLTLCSSIEPSPEIQRSTTLSFSSMPDSLRIISMPLISLPSIKYKAPEQPPAAPVDAILLR